MRKYIKIILLIVLVVLLAVGGFAYFAFRNNKKSEGQKVDLSLLSDQQVIKILETNENIKEYAQKYPDFTILSKEILTKESIIAGQNGQSLQPLYSGLELEDNRYMKVQLMDKTGGNGFFGVIDAKDSSVTKAFGILLFQASADSFQNGKKAIAP